MLVADENTNPYFQELCDAAKEIAELKAQISRLEKMVDGVLAQHLAGQDQLPAAIIAPDVPLQVADHETDLAEFDSNDHTDVDPDHYELTPDEVEPNAEIFVAQDESEDWDVQPDHDMVADDSVDQDPAIEAEDGPAAEAIATTDSDVLTSPATGSLPSALRSLICRPLTTALSSPDDLTLIKGIDCATALELAAHGLSRFEDIAALDAAKIEDLRAAVAHSERLHKDVWIEQAAVLAKGNLTTFARQTRENRQVEDTTFTLKPELIPFEHGPTDDAPDFTASEIIVDEKMIFDSFVVDQATAVLNDLATRDMPRQMRIDRQLADIRCCKEGETSFLPMAATDAGFAVEKIAHVPPRPERDFGNVRALAASLSAAAVIYIATSTSGILSFDMSVAQMMQTDVCALTSWSSYPDACKQIFGNVL